MYDSFATNAAVNVNRVSGNNWSSIINMFGQFFFLIIVFIFILFLAYYSTKLIAKAKSGSIIGGNIKIIESFSLGINASLQIVKVGGKYFLISVTKDNINLISEIEEDKLELNEKKNFDLKFENVIKDCIDKIKSGKGKNG
ncbi:MAG: flagellar biosynthetic protein FliO [Firmicutes bacterium]|nr:flagellar biosynthetic protein FliO [Bacillota bacterium]